MAEGPYWGWSILGGGGLLDSNLGAVSTSLGLTSPAPGATASSAGGGSDRPGATQQTATGGSPAPGDRWQGGAANPNGTQDQYGNQTGGRYVDPTYQTDANGNPLTPDQQAYWREYDRKRAERASIARSWAAVGQNSGPTASGLDYDPKTGKWKYYDTKTKGWAEGNSIDDIYNTIFNEKQKAEHPLSYYQNLQQSQDQGERSRIQSNYRQSQSDALMSTPTTRYQPVNF